MKYILNDSRTRDTLSAQTLPLLSTPAFFFHDRGVFETQKSFDGLLRSILYQILSTVPELTTAISDIYYQSLAEYGQCSWKISELENAFRAILRQQAVQGCICLFVDALDEYKGRKEDISRFLKELATRTPEQKIIIRICASSREWNVFNLLLGNNPCLTVQDWTVDDLKRFATERLEEAQREGSDVLLNEITERAEGVFLWVKLVIRELWQPLCDGELIPNLVSLLSDLPDELPQFYERMLKNIPTRDRATGLSMISLVLSSEYRGLLTSELSLAVDFIYKDRSIPKAITWKLDDKRHDELERRIKACSGGLLEITKSKVVQFVHQTAKSYVQDSKNRAMFDGRSAKELTLAALQQRMRLIIQLLGHSDTRSVYIFALLISRSVN
jgi:hypothetical protein